MSDNIPTKADLLAEYAQREPARFIEYFADLTEGDNDDFRQIDTFELAAVHPVRVLIDRGVQPDRAALALRKIAAQIERNCVERPPCGMTSLDDLATWLTDSKNPLLVAAGDLVKAAQRKPPVAEDDIPF